MEKKKSWALFVANWIVNSPRKQILAVDPEDLRGLLSAVWHNLVTPQQAKQWLKTRLEV